MAKKIFLGNYKGGVGKTTSAFYLAKQFADKRNKKILIIDLDPQCSMSEICVRSYDADLSLSSLKDNETLNYMLDMAFRKKQYTTNLCFDIETIVKICTQLHEKVEFIPTSLFYADNFATYEARKVKRNIIGLDGLVEKLQIDMDKNILLLQEVISPLEKEYEFIFFDCPPSNNILTKSAFLLSDFYIIPYISDNISIKGVEHYISTVNKIYDDYCCLHHDAEFYRLIFKEKPVLLGIFECMRIRNENPRGNIGAIKDGQDSPVKKYNTVIKNLIGIQEALSAGRTTEEFGLYEQLAEEILQDL